MRSKECDCSRDKNLLANPCMSRVYIYKHVVLFRISFKAIET